MATPRLQRVRHRAFARVRHSRNLSAWISAQATRLEVTTTAIFNLLLAGSSAEDIEATPDP